MTAPTTDSLEVQEEKLASRIGAVVNLHVIGMSNKEYGEKILAAISDQSWDLYPTGSLIKYEDIRDGDFIRVEDTDMTLLIRAARTPSGVFGGLLSMVPRTARFYLAERPNPLEPPTEPGSLIRVDFHAAGTTTLALGKDSTWHGISHALTDEQLRTELTTGEATLIEVIA